MLPKGLSTIRINFKLPEKNLGGDASYEDRGYFNNICNTEQT